jgi:hypothetical protein
MNGLQGEKGLIQHLFYQHNVQAFFIRHIEKYGGVIVPFSIATAFQTGTYGFVRALLAKDRTKQFALDPRTALFQKHWTRTNAREPHKRVASIFGTPFSDIGLTRPLMPNDMRGKCESVTKGCLDYQLNFRVLQEEQKKLEKYRKLLGMDALPEIKNPQRFIPPYFQFDSTADPWFEVNLRCAAHSVTMVPDAQTCMVLHVGAFPSPADWKHLIGSIKKSGIKQCFLYPNKFKEHDEDETRLRAYGASISLLSSEGVQPEILHGGYYAILLSKIGSLGFGNGIGYSEWRDSGYHKGGTAETRVYIPKLHRFLDAAAAQTLINANTEYFTSDSDLLSEYAAAQKPVTQITAAEALDHFMQCRYQEMTFVDSQPLMGALSELQETIKVLKKIGPLQLEQFGQSLRRWIASLTG